MTEAAITILTLSLVLIVALGISFLILLIDRVLKKVFNLSFMDRLKELF